MKHQASRIVSLHLASAFLGALALVVGCNDESPTQPLEPVEAAPVADAGGTPAPATCIDEDHDGFGDGCLSGDDCDDSNPNVTDECYRCNNPNEGCPCADEGKSASCGTEAVREGTRTTCVVAERECSNGTWGKCVAKGTKKDSH